MSGGYTGAVRTNLPTYTTLVRNRLLYGTIVAARMANTCAVPVGLIGNYQMLKAILKVFGCFQERLAKYS